MVNSENRSDNLRLALDYLKLSNGLKLSNSDPEEDEKFLIKEINAIRNNIMTDYHNAIRLLEMTIHNISSIVTFKGTSGSYVSMTTTAAKAIIDKKNELDDPENVKIDLCIKLLNKYQNGDIKLYSQQSINSTFLNLYKREILLPEEESIDTNSLSSSFAALSFLRSDIDEEELMTNMVYTQISDTADHDDHTNDTDLFDALGKSIDVG